MQFIRSPGYYRPKHNFAYPLWQRLLFKIPGVLRLYRWKIFYEYDKAILSRGTGTWTSDMRESSAKVRHAPPPFLLLLLLLLLLSLRTLR